VAKTLHERYQALGGHRVGWFYTNRIRMHGQMRDIETCEQLYEEARSRKVEVDGWFYRAMIIACGQVRYTDFWRRKTRLVGRVSDSTSRPFAARTLKAAVMAELVAVSLHTVRRH